MNLMRLFVVFLVVTLGFGAFGAAVGGLFGVGASGPVGVYGGASTNTYLTKNLLQNARVDTAGLPTLFGNDGDYLTTRVSYKLNLKGPSLDTACESSTFAGSVLAVGAAYQLTSSRPVAAYQFNPLQFRAAGGTGKCNQKERGAKCA